MSFTKVITGDKVLEVYGTQLSQLSGSLSSSLATRKVDNFNIVLTSSTRLYHSSKKKISGRLKKPLD